jgi:hypothetical protein
MKDRASITVRTRSKANMQKAKARVMGASKQAVGRG